MNEKDDMRRDEDVALEQEHRYECFVDYGRLPGPPRKMRESSNVQEWRRKQARRLQRGRNA